MRLLKTWKCQLLLSLVVIFFFLFLSALREEKKVKKAIFVSFFLPHSVASPNSIDSYHRPEKPDNESKFLSHLRFQLPLLSSGWNVAFEIARKALLSHVPRFNDSFVAELNKRTWLLQSLLNYVYRLIGKRRNSKFISIFSKQKLSNRLTISVL